MAKHGRRKFRRYQRGVVNQTQVLTGLAAVTGIKQAFAGLVTETTWVSSVKAQYFLSDFAAVANAGPITVYLMHSDYTLAEFESYIEALAATSWDISDKVSREIARRGRFIKMVGQFFYESGHSVTDVLGISGGKPITTKLGWRLYTGDTVAVVYYNPGSAALTGGTPDALILGHANLWPN